MRNLSATFIVTEGGEVSQLTWIDETSSNITQQSPVDEAPSLFDFETALDWRAALAAYAVETLAKAGYVHADRSDLVYVSKGCHIYVYEIDFLTMVRK